MEAGTITHRETKNFKLFEGLGMGKGCFAIQRKSDGLTTLWNTGTEGKEEKEELMLLSEEDFDTQCKQKDFS